MQDKSNESLVDIEEGFSESPKILFKKSILIKTLQIEVISNML